MLLARLLSGPEATISSAASTWVSYAPGPFLCGRHEAEHAYRPYHLSQAVCLLSEVIRWSCGWFGKPRWETFNKYI